MLTEQQIAKWVVAAVEPIYRYAFAKARAANQRVVAGIIVANSGTAPEDETRERVEEAEEVENFWNNMAKRIHRSKNK